MYAVGLVYLCGNVLASRSAWPESSQVISAHNRPVWDEEVAQHQHQSRRHPSNLSMSFGRGGVVEVDVVGDCLEGRSTGYNAKTAEMQRRSAFGTDAFRFK